jgi:vinculin
LQGVSAILITFDESEVRKIIKVCNQVIEYLSITELIEKMDDLVTYVKVIRVILDLKRDLRLYMKTTLFLIIFKLESNTDSNQND